MKNLTFCANLKQRKIKFIRPFYVVMILSLLIFACGSDDIDSGNDDLFGGLESDCIDLCAFGDAVQTTSEMPEPCGCDCFDGFYGELCDQYDEPIAFNIVSIQLTDWPEFNNSESWDDGSSTEKLPDFKIYINDNNSGNLIGETSMINNIAQGTTPTYIGSPFPLTIPIDAELRFAIVDESTDSSFDFDVLLLGYFQLTEANFLQNDNSNFSISWTLSESERVEIKLIGNWIQ